MFRLGERVRLDLPEPYSGATVEVDSIVSRVIASRAVALATAFLEADGEDEIVAMVALFEFLCREGRPTWDIVDHHGPVPTTPAGLGRLPTPLFMSIVDGWTDTLPHAGIDQAGPQGGLPVDMPSDADLAVAKRRMRVMKSA